MPISLNTKISEHFTLVEFLASQTAARQGIDNTPTPEIDDNLIKTAALMEKVRTLLGGRPIFVSSGYRSPALNAAVGGVANSAHVTGQACDFTCPDYGPVSMVCTALEAEAALLDYDQLIREFDADGHGWCHIAWAEHPRHMALTIDGRGTQTGIVV